MASPIACVAPRDQRNLAVQIAHQDEVQIRLQNVFGELAADRAMVEHTCEGSADRALGWRQRFASPGKRRHDSTLYVRATMSST
jgi:hypothetical protein